jgi:C1A family cysteine protease
MQAALPSLVDLRKVMPPIYDQGYIGSCTGNAIAGALQYERMRHNLSDSDRVPSRLMIYYGEREMEGTVSSDAGGYLRDGIKFAASVGACYEDGPDGWPYDPKSWSVKPAPACYTAAVRDRVITYSAVQQATQQICGALAAGDPVIFGFTVYPAFDSPEVARTGRVPLPAPGDAPLGGHAVLIVGYDLAERNFLIRNSWGAGWGLKGYFLMPFEYVLRADLASDFWVIGF